MNRNASNTDAEKKGKNEGMLEKIAHAIDPPGREVSDEELMDPGANIPDDPLLEENRGRTPQPRK